MAHTELYWVFSNLGRKTTKKNVMEKKQEQWWHQVNGQKFTMHLYMLINKAIRRVTTFFKIKYSAINETGEYKKWVGE